MDDADRVVMVDSVGVTGGSGPLRPLAPGAPVVATPLVASAPSAAVTPVAPITPAVEIAELLDEDGLQHLAQALRRSLPPGSGGPTRFAGSLLGPATPVGVAVSARAALAADHRGTAALGLALLGDDGLARVVVVGDDLRDAGAAAMRDALQQAVDAGCAAHPLPARVRADVLALPGHLVAVTFRRDDDGPLLAAPVLGAPGYDVLARPAAPSVLASLVPEGWVRRRPAGGAVDGGGRVAALALAAVAAGAGALVAALAGIGGTGQLALPAGAGVLAYVLAADRS